MENIVVFQKPHSGPHQGPTGFLNPQDPWYPCNAVATQYQQACYLIQTSVILTFNGYNFTQAFRECDKAPREFIPTCYQSMGRDISGFALRDAKRVIALCGLGSGHTIRHCLVGAVKDVIWTHADPERGVAFCRLLDERHKQDCYAAVGEILLSLYPDQERRQQVCTGVEKDYIAVCTVSARS